MSIKYKGKTVSGGGTQFTTDDTLTMSADNVLSVTTPVKAVTQAEYDAMSEEERKGFKIIKDANISLRDRGEVYSTEETIIGTWIDGRPLYRQLFVLSDNFVLPAETINVIVDVGENAQLKKAECFLLRPDKKFELLPNIFSQVRLAGEKVEVFIWERFVGSSIAYDGGYVICEYTKTTDKAVSEW